MDMINVNCSNNTSNDNELLEEKNTCYQHGLIKCAAATPMRGPFRAGSIYEEVSCPAKA